MWATVDATSPFKDGEALTSLPEHVYSLITCWITKYHQILLVTLVVMCFIRANVVMLHPQQKMCNWPPANDPSLSQDKGWPGGDTGQRTNTGSIIQVFGSFYFSFFIINPLWQSIFINHLSLFFINPLWQSICINHPAKKGCWTAASMSFLLSCIRHPGVALNSALNSGS